MKWFLNKVLNRVILRERKRQVKLGHTRDSDVRKGTVGLTLIARQYQERGKYVEALAILAAATDNANIRYVY